MTLPITQRFVTFFVTATGLALALSPVLPVTGCSSSSTPAGVESDGGGSSASSHGSGSTGSEKSSGSKSGGSSGKSSAESSSSSASKSGGLTICSTTSGKTCSFTGSSDSNTCYAGGSPGSCPSAMLVGCCVTTETAEGITASSGTCYYDATAAAAAQKMCMMGIMSVWMTVAP